MDRVRAAASSMASGCRRDAAELDHGRRRCRVECELRPRRAPGSRTTRPRRRRRRSRRRDRHDSLRGYPEPLAARGDHPHVGCTGRDRVHDRRDAQPDAHSCRSPAAVAGDASARQARDIVLARRQRVAQRLQQQRGDAFRAVYTGARSTNHAPSANSGWTTAATCNPSLVFPTPPGPVSVTTAVSVTSPAICSIDAARRTTYWLHRRSPQLADRLATGELVSGVRVWNTRCSPRPRAGGHPDRRS